MNVFDDIRVVEVGGGMAVGLAGLLYADFGADVVKVEPPWGDWSRGSRGFEMWGRGKRSVVRDLREPRGRADALQLLAAADVVLEGLRPGAAASLGVDYETVAASNPGVVYCSISGFGEDVGPGGAKPYEQVVAATIGQWIGLDHVQGLAVGVDPKQPIYKIAPVNSYAASQLAFQGTAAALRHRQLTGVGQRLHTSLVQGAMSQIMRREISPEDASKERPSDLIYRGIHLTFLCVECSDGKWIQMCARQDHHFRNWLLALDLEELAEDPRYCNGPLRIPTVEDIEEIEARIRVRMSERTQGEWMQLFVESYDIGADPVLTPEEFLAHPQVILNGYVVDLDHPQHGHMRQVGPIANLSETPAVPPRPAPVFDPDAPLPMWQPRARLHSVGNGHGGSAKHPLEGVTILELAYFVAAPLGPALLAELGARVVKVEPKDGDPWRRVGLDSLPFMHGKESIALDLKAPESAAVLRDLIAISDVLVTNFRPGVPERLGFGYADAAAVNPELVYVYAASYGSKGPHAHRPAFHSTPNALAGSAIFQAGAGNIPVDDGFPDPCAGLAVATAAMLGILARDRTGTGQYIETSMLTSTGFVLADYLVDYSDAPAHRLNAHDQRGVSALRRLYACRDGSLLIRVDADDQWRRLADALGDPRLRDERFGTRVGRDEHDGELTSLLSEWFALAATAESEVLLVTAGVPAAAVNEVGMLKYFEAHGHVMTAHHPAFGDYWRLGPKVDLFDTNSRLAAASAVGEHTAAILNSLGYPTDEVKKMIEAGAAA